MNILLLGEYSSLHNNLKEGLQELGHDAVLAGTGDGYKKLPVDISFDSNLPWLIGKYTRRIKPLLYLNKIKDYDIVQLMNPFIFYQKYFPTQYYYRKIKEQNKKFFMLAAGDDSFFWRNGRKRLKYGPFDDSLKYDMKKDICYMEMDKAYEFNKNILELSNGIIPIMYEYEISYKGERKLLNTIPIPINTNKIKYVDNNVQNKLVIFHGLNRYGFKGTRHIEKAFSILRDKYPNDLELIIDGRMPLNEYLKVMQKTNVIIDQMYSHSLGVNGIYAMAMGKVVMGGAEPESLHSIGVNNSPVINLQPNYKSIVDEVEKLLAIRTQIKDLGYESRQFVENIHGHIKVANQYIKTWEEN